MASTGRVSVGLGCIAIVTATACAAGSSATGTSGWSDDEADASSGSHDDGASDSGSDGDDGGDASASNGASGATDPSTTSANASGAGSDTSSGQGGDDSGSGSGGGNGDGGSDDSSGAGSGGGAGATCGTATCQAGQTCEAGQCVFTCDGATVPGDYATIQSAVTALAPTGGIICVQPGTYVEDVYMGGSITFCAGELTLRGASAETTHVQGRISAGDCGGRTTTLEGLHVTKGVTSGYVHLAMHGDRIDNDSGPGVSLGQYTDAVIDACDVSAETYAAIQVYYGSGADERLVEIRSSYVHGGTSGLYAAAGSGTTANILLHGNTFRGSNTAVQTSGGNVVLSMFNNLFTENGIAVLLASATEIEQGHNALFGNVTNYAGVATAGDGYVTVDCMLDDATTPPRLASGSPCRDAGDPAVGPATDYYGLPRSGAPDIGAVEGE